MAFNLIEYQDRGADDYAQQEGPEWVTADHPWGSGSDVTIAIFTALLFLVSVWQVFLWIKANNTANAALEAANEATIAAKRSVDSYVASERAKVIISDATMGWSGAPESARGVLYNFLNIGRGTAMSLGVGHRLEFVPMDATVPNPREATYTKERSYHPIESMGTLGTSDREFQGRLQWLVPHIIQNIEAVAHIGQKHRLIFQGWVLYQTLDRTYKSFFTMECKPVDMSSYGQRGDFNAYGGEDYNNEEEIEGNDPWSHLHGAIVPNRVAQPSSYMITRLIRNNS